MPYNYCLRAAIKTTIITILLLIFFPSHGHAVMSVYDSEENFKYRIDDEGIIYNNQGKIRARIIENKVYDSILNRFWFRIDGDKIYNRKDELRYCVVGHRVVDTEGKLKYYIKGKPLAELKWNNQSLHMQ